MKLKQILLALIAVSVLLSCSANKELNAKNEAQKVEIAQL
jgi:outer membrane biogenesis lipoprotein LolB